MRAGSDNRTNDADVVTVLKLSFMFVPAVLAGLFSFWNLQALGLSWWDEYDFVLTAKWFLGRPDGVFSIYEPPGFPFVMSIMFRLFGVRDFVAIATSGVFAVLTVVLVTYIGLKWFGYGAGAAASILLAVNSMFLSFARFAMTDMAFIFFFTAAVYFLYVPLRTTRPRDVMLGAVCFACCAAIKYNAFMAFLVPLVYVPFVATKGNHIRVVCRNLLLLLAMLVPTLLIGMAFLIFLGIGGSLHNLFSLHTLKTVATSFPALVRVGFGKFVTGAVLHAHSSQLMFTPLAESGFYLITIWRFVQWPIFIPLGVGFVVLVWNAREREEARFLIFWFVMVFFLVSSIPVGVPRTIVPILTPMSLIAGVGVVNLRRIVNMPGNVLKGLHGGIRLRHMISVAFLAIVLISSLPSALQTVSITHGAYRQAGTLLDSISGGRPVLAETQLVLDFYYPHAIITTGSGPLTEAAISKEQFLIVDYDASAMGYNQTIQRLQSQGQITLLASIPNDLPEIVYLDRMTFAQYDALNGTFINIYRVNNATQSTNG